MKKLFICSIILFAIGSAAFAAKFKDIPKNHWAQDSVYDLVKMGVTAGYPDGTFRGNKSVNRYEMASQMSKLSKYLIEQSESASREKVRQIVKEELASNGASKNDSWDFSGFYQVRAKLTGVFAENAKLLTPEHRLKFNIIKSMQNDLKVGLDMDSRTTPLWGNEGFGTTWDFMKWGQYDIFQAGVFDWWAFGTIDGIFLPMKLEVSNGIGDGFHKGDSLSLKNSTLFDNISLGFAYGRNSVVSNRNASNKYSGLFNYNNPNAGALGIANVDLNATLFVDVNQLKPTTNKRDWNLLAKITNIPNPKIKIEGRIGFSAFDGHGVYLAGLLWIKDLWWNGSQAFLEAHKLGTSYITTYGDSWVGTDVMDYYITDGANKGTTYIGGKIIQQIDEKWGLQGRFTFHLTGGVLGSASLLRIEPGVTYKAAKNIDTYLYYRYWYDYVTPQSGDRFEAGVIIRL